MNTFGDDVTGLAKLSAQGICDPGLLTDEKFSRFIRHQRILCLILQCPVAGLCMELSQINAGSLLLLRLAEHSDRSFQTRGIGKTIIGSFSLPPPVAV
ncbi:MAG: hypothetical protein ABIH17_07705 [Pseudomonadota bacterium]